MKRVFLPELLYSEGTFRSGRAVIVSDSGEIASIEDGSRYPDGIHLAGRAMLPGLVNAHSHSFQRIFRGGTENCQGPRENFWSWRNTMYRAAHALSPDDLYAVARMAFLEMALSGITTVGEFHYVHRDPSGYPYADPNLTSHAMVRAAREVGLRICLLRVAYMRSGFNKPPDPLQARFIEPVDDYLRNVDALSSALDGTFAWCGVAPHSVRAVRLDAFRELTAWAVRERLPIHAHVAEQPAEVEECRAEYGVTPVALLAREGLLHERFTGVHGIHVTNDEILALAHSGAFVCACPTTERNLGDGVVPAAALKRAGVRIALGSDSQAQIDILEDARELEYHQRLLKGERGLHRPSELFECATRTGMQSLQVPGEPADYFTVDLRNPSIAGKPLDRLLSSIVFGLNRTAVRDVIVGGEPIVSEGRHVLQEEIVDAFMKICG